MKKVLISAIVMALFFFSSCSLEEVEPENAENVRTEEILVPTTTDPDPEDPDQKSGG